MYLVYFNLLFVGVLASFGFSKPIMVSYGTNDGPIVPPSPTTTTLKATFRNKKPAPVFESREDVPNPSVYKAIGPNAYRREIYSHKPNPNLILGTPLDISYGPIVDKYSRKRQIKSLGLEHRGAQFFETQPYEYEQAKLEERIRRKDERYRQSDSQYYEDKRVPQIGVVYSSGIKYYVPQIVHRRYEEDNNSVYDRSDSKYEDDSRDSSY